MPTTPNSSQNSYYHSQNRTKTLLPHTSPPHLFSTTQSKHSSTTCLTPRHTYTRHQEQQETRQQHYIYQNCTTLRASLFKTSPKPQPRQLHHSHTQPPPYHRKPTSCLPTRNSPNSHPSFSSQTIKPNKHKHDNNRHYKSPPSPLPPPNTSKPTT